MLRALGREQDELSILLCDDDIIQGLNRDFRDTDKATDVLAFAMSEGAVMVAGGGPVLLGDVVISLDTARRQALGNDRAIVDEVTFLLGHGLLHLLGLDHRDPAEERHMMALTWGLCAAASRRR